jgi:hypothetical protein
MQSPTSPERPPDRPKRAEIPDRRQRHPETQAIVIATSTRHKPQTAVVDEEEPLQLRPRRQPREAPTRLSLHISQELDGHPSSRYRPAAPVLSSPDPRLSAGLRSVVPHGPGLRCRHGDGRIRGDQGIEGRARIVPATGLTWIDVHESMRGRDGWMACPRTLGLISRRRVRWLV